MKIAVTGASGRIGNVVARELLNAGYQVRALLRRDSPALAGLTLERVPGDLFQQDALDQLTSGCDALIHLAAQVSIHGSMGGKVHTTNVEGTRSVLKAALRNGIQRVVHFSSIHAFKQLPKEGLFDESRPLAFQSRMAYDRSKAEAMDFVFRFGAEHGMEVLALCPTSVIGPFDFEPSLSGQMFLDFYRQKIPLLVPGGFDWCDVRDVAGASVTALRQGKSGEAYLLPGRYASVKEIAQITRKITGKATPKLTAPDWLLRLGVPFVMGYGNITGQRPLYTHDALNTLRDGSKQISAEKAKSHLGYSTRPLEASIADAYQWFEQNGYL